jgi:hypothetical protein
MWTILDASGHNHIYYLNTLPTYLVLYSLPTQKPSALSADSLYRSVKLLPQTLQYDYERRRIAQEAGKISTPMSRLLGDGTAKAVDGEVEQEEVGAAQVRSMPMLAASSESL